LNRFVPYISTPVLSVLLKTSCHGHATCIRTASTLRAVPLAVIVTAIIATAARTRPRHPCTGELENMTHCLPPKSMVSPVGMPGPHISRTEKLGLGNRLLIDVGRVIIRLARQGIINLGLSLRTLHRKASPVLKERVPHPCSARVSLPPLLQDPAPAASNLHHAHGLIRGVPLRDGVPLASDAHGPIPGVGLRDEVPQAPTIHRADGPRASFNGPITKKSKTEAKQLTKNGQAEMPRDNFASTITQETSHIIIARHLLVKGGEGGDARRSSRHAEEPRAKSQSVSYVYAGTEYADGTPIDTTARPRS
jgi:hypothetical protein